MPTQTYGAYTALTVTNLQSLANSSTVGWQSDVIDNRTTGAIDYEILFYLPMANTAPANDRSWYFYAVPAVHNGTAFVYSDGGTTTLPSGTQGAYTIAGTSSTNNLILLRRFFYTTQNQIVSGWASLSSAVGQTMPDGFSIVGVNFTGAAAITGCVVAYRAIT
jgi:hypothetical protein